MVDGNTQVTFEGIARYEIRFLGSFPHIMGLTLERLDLKEGDRLVVLKMTSDLEAVVMLETKERESTHLI